MHLFLSSLCFPYTRRYQTIGRRLINFWLNRSGRVQFGCKTCPRHRKRVRRPAAFPYYVNNAGFLLFFPIVTQLIKGIVLCRTMYERRIGVDLTSTRSSAGVRLNKHETWHWRLFLYQTLILSAEQGISYSSYVVNTGLRLFYHRQRVYTWPPHAIGRWLTAQHCFGWPRVSLRFFFATGGTPQTNTQSLSP